MDIKEALSNINELLENDRKRNNETGYTCITYYDENGYLTELKIQAIAILISEYTRQKEINEEHQKENGELQNILTKEKELTRVQTEYDVNKFWTDKIKAKRDEYMKLIKEMEEKDIGIGFTLGKEMPRLEIWTINGKCT